MQADVYKRLMFFHGPLKDIDYKGRQEIICKKLITNLISMASQVHLLGIIARDPKRAPHCRNNDTWQY